MASLHRGAGEIQMGGGYCASPALCPHEETPASTHPSAGLASPGQGRHFGKDLVWPMFRMLILELSFLKKF